MTRFHPEDVRAVMAANAPKLIALAQELSRHTASLNLSRKEPRDDRSSSVR